MLKGHYYESDRVTKAAHRREYLSGVCVAAHDTLVVHDVVRIWYETAAGSDPCSAGRNVWLGSMQRVERFRMKKRGKSHRWLDSGAKATHFSSIAGSRYLRRDDAAIV